jgi:hypothetical protein
LEEMFWTGGRLDWRRCFGLEDAWTGGDVMDWRTLGMEEMFWTGGRLDWRRCFGLEETWAEHLDWRRCVGWRTMDWRRRRRRGRVFETNIWKDGSLEMDQKTVNWS